MELPHHHIADLPALLDLQAVKPDAFLGESQRLGWGRIYGGQVVAQALAAACRTIEAPFVPHSMHAYFVRAGDERKPVLFEVDRVRDGRSFGTRQVVAYQEGGAILNLIASFQTPEPAEDDVQSVQMPDAAAPEGLEPIPHDTFLEHRVAGREMAPLAHALTWLKASNALGDDPMLHACAFAYLSDEDMLGVGLFPHPLAGRWDDMMTASLDHAIWFHRPFRADEWLLFDVDGHGVANARGLAMARVYSRDGVHVASVAQEALGRRRRAQ